jgi:hypothetical protein
MKVLLLTLLPFGTILRTSATVYICNSPNVTRYHLTAKCRDLSNCSHRIVAVTLEKAKSMNLTLGK